MSMQSNLTIDLPTPRPADPAKSLGRSHGGARNAIATVPAPAILRTGFPQRLFYRRRILSSVGCVSRLTAT